MHNAATAALIAFGIGTVSAIDTAGQKQKLARTEIKHWLSRKDILQIQAH